jgi:predicted MFS family arabinose efflux permease
MTGSTMQAQDAAQAAERNVTLRIIPAVAYTFVAYLCIGVFLATLPGFVHQQLGLSAVLAGLFVSLQYVATFATRSYAGRMTDTLGPRQTVRKAMIFCGASGLFMVLAGLLQRYLWWDIGALVLSRLSLGIGESLTAVGAIMWGIGRVGTANTAKVISWNGVATYVPIALGAPVGILIASKGGISMLGIFVAFLCAIGFLATTRMASTKAPEGKLEPIRNILPRVTPYGLALSLGGMGFGVIAAFITLYFAHENWEGAALSLTIYGLSFVTARLLFAGLIDKFGGFSIAMISFAIEAVGLGLLATNHSREVAYIGCGLTGLGFSLVFPALGVEVAETFPISSRGSVLAVYSAFVDLSLFLTGPIAGLVISLWGYPAIFVGVAALVLLALGLTLWLASKTRREASRGDAMTAI